MDVPPKDIFRTTSPEANDPEDIALRRIARSVGTRAVGIDGITVEPGIAGKSDVWKPLKKRPALEVRIYVGERVVFVRYAGSPAFVRLMPNTIETFPVLADASELEVSHPADAPLSVMYRWRNG